MDAAESTPAAAREGANSIRRFLTKDYANRAYAQYNAVMLMRILTDNPGPTFTRNFDAAFVKTVKELLRDGRDLSVQQILRETLDSFAAGKTENETLGLLMEMWKKEKAKNNTKVYGNSVSASYPRHERSVVIIEQAGPNVPPGGPPLVSQAGNHFARQHRQPRSLPPPDELAARIEEAKTTAKLLSQTVQSTPSAEIPNNDLIKEFAYRASSASRSIQGYIHSTNPAPDEDTLLTLIETNEHLSIAMSKHQRAVLQARRTLTNSPPAPAPSLPNQDNSPAPTGPPPGALGAVKSQDYMYPPPQQSPPQRAQDHTYSPPPPPPPQRAPPPTQQHQHQHQHQQHQQQWHRDPRGDYDVPENPFSDPTAHQPAPPPAPQQQYGLFHRSQNQAAAPQSRHEDTPSPTKPLPTRPENQMPAFQSTPSYAYRQEAAANNLTMHGATPPPPLLSGRADQGGDVQQQQQQQQRVANMRA